MSDQSSYYGGNNPMPGMPPRPGQPNINNTGIPGAFGLYNTAVEQQAKDYDSIMSGYKGFNSSQPMQNFGELAATGGYSEADKSNIRERGISPIRSIYASANRDVDRQKAIQGGYSPNYGAVKAKMARDLSSQIGDQVTNVNATLAQNIAQNRIGLAPSYAAQSFAPLQGQASLYGTTPALASTFGNQALQSANLQNDIYQGSGPVVGGGQSASSGRSPGMSNLLYGYKNPTMGPQTVAAGQGYPPSGGGR